jgi:asparagine synthase (glutamine-hydrolysing)
MCGIAGAFFVADPSAVERFAAIAAACLTHRGPDDEGLAHFPEGIFVHRRLSILDPTPAGHQPYRSDDGSVSLVHNGEIYNYLELRDELRSLGDAFRTDTDTEVILAAYRRWGPDAVKRFNGIWAFAIWDAAARRLLLSRDRLGVKPLYHTRLGAGIAFASEIKALRTMLPKVRPNLGALRDYAWSGLVDHADETFLEGIEPVPPGENLLVSGDVRQRLRYWTMPQPETDPDPVPQPEDHARIEAFNRLLREAVGLQLRSDVLLGSCLSGGIDSAAIVTLASQLVAERLGPHEAAPRMAFTASFPGWSDDETDRATIVAGRAGVAHRLVTLRPGDLIATLDEVLVEQDEPFGSASILAQRAVMEAASHEGIKVMLDGQGSDELLAGYLHYRYAWLLGLLRHRPASVPGALRDLRRLGMRPWVALRQAALEPFRLGRTGHAPLGRESRPPAWLGAVLRSADPLPLRGAGLGPGDAVVSSPAATPLARRLRQATVSTSLPALLRYEDRNSMRFGVEARVPYLDHRLVEAAVALPDRLRIANGITKVVLRQAMNGIVPDEVRLDRRKIGFAVPQVDWLSTSLPAIRAALSDSLAVREGLLDRSGTSALLERPLSVDGGAEVWRALSIDRWLRLNVG